MRITESQLRKVIRGILAEQAEQPSDGLADMIVQYRKNREERVASAPAEPLPVTSIPKRGKTMDVAKAMETWIISHFPELRGEFLATGRPAVRWGSNLGTLGGYVEPQAVVETKGKFNEVWDLMQTEMGPQQTYNRNVVGGNDPVDYIPWGGFIFTKMRGGSGLRIGISTKRRSRNEEIRRTKMRLTESQLRRMIREQIRKKENDVDDPHNMSAMSALEKGYQVGPHGSYYKPTDVNEFNVNSTPDAIIDHLCDLPAGKRSALLRKLSDDQIKRIAYTAGMHESNPTRAMILRKIKEIT